MSRNPKIILTAVFSLLMLSSIAQQVEATTITCLQVQADGSVGITWTEIPDANAIFNQYNLGTHNTVSQVTSTFQSEADITNTFFLDNTVDATIAPVYYQINVQPVSGSGGIASFSNILSTLLLNGIFTSGTVNLTWSDPVPSYSSVPAGTVYNLMEEFPVGDWHEVASFPYEIGLENYDHDVSVCDDAANYRLELQFPGAACSSISNEITLIVTDEIAPPVPQITSISVDTISGQAVIDWNNVDAPDCGGYIVTWCDAPGLPQTQQILDCNQTEFVFPTANPQASSEFFLVASFDTCSVAPNISPTEGNCPFIHNSIHLTTSWTTCQETINLNWTNYTGWGNNGVTFYEVYRRDNGGDSQIIATLDPDITSYTDTSIEPDSEYCYFIWAYSATVNNAQSISNISCELTLGPATPAVFNVFSASVNNNDQTLITVNTALTPSLFNYVLLRKSDRDPFFQEISTTISNGNVSPLILPDSDVNTAAFSYDYKIALINQCNDTVDVSNIGRTIKVSGLANSESLINTITWNAYEEWENGVDSYEIYRTIDDGAPELIAVNQPGVLYFEDDVSNQLESKGEFCYFITAVEGANSLGVSAQSFSNVLCLAQPPKVWIPNAIALNGINDEFFPVVSFADRDTYRLIIFNRWGQELFITNDINETWDGTKDGNIVQEGTYTYYMEIADGSGQFFEYRGPVTLLIMDAN